MKKSEKEFLRRCDDVDLSFLKKAPYRQWSEKLKKDLSEHRYLHTLGVVKSAIVLAKQYGADVQKAILAAYLHDCAKKQEREYFELFLNEGLLKPIDWRESATFHSFLGAMAAREVYGVEDPLVLYAIECHPMGREKMSDLDRILYVADMIEPGRDYEDVHMLREIALDGLREVTYQSMNRNLVHLLESDVVVEVESLKARNVILRERMRFG